MNIWIPRFNNLGNERSRRLGPIAFYFTGFR